MFENNRARLFNNGGRIHMFEQREVRESGMEDDIGSFSMHPYTFVASEMSQKGLYNLYIYIVSGVGMFEWSEIDY